MKNVNFRTKMLNQDASLATILSWLRARHIWPMMAYRGLVQAAMQAQDLT
jgi:hypothetical protein